MIIFFDMRCFLVCRFLSKEEMLHYGTVVLIHNDIITKVERSVYE